MTLTTVKVPPKMELLFEEAERIVSAYFAARRDRPAEGTIEIAGERYVMVRAASLSVEFFSLVEKIFGPERIREADDFARNLLFDLAHAVGKADAKSFHAKMGLEDPIARLSAGPVHFAHTGWAFVDISPESRPEPSEEYSLLYDHPYAFEADAWIRSGRKADFPVCVMNAGYSSGWCEESFGMALVASEILCRAKGDDCCRFIMAPPARIVERIGAYMNARPELASRIQASEIPDLFARRRAEELLRDSEERYRTIIESSIDSILITDLETRAFQYANPELCRMLGYTAEELKTMHLEDIHPKEALPEILKHFKGQACGDRTQGFDIPFLRKDGGIVYADIRVAITMLGGRTSALGTFRDITERKSAEETIRQQRDFLHCVIESFDHPFYVINAETRGVELANRACFRGAFPAGTTCHALAYRSETPCDSPKHPCPLEIVRRTRAPAVVEHVHDDAGGNTRTVEVHAYPLVDERGVVTRVIEYSIDITARKHVAMRVAALNECLLSLGADHQKNVNLITATAGRILGADFALYNRITGDALHGVGSWNVPPGLQPNDLAKGHICADVVAEGASECVVIRDLPSTPYAESDPAVRMLGLRTYIGHAIRAGGRPVGSLCTAFTRDVDPNTDDLKSLGALAGTLGVEEERHAAVERLSDKLREIEKLNSFMTDRERRIVEMKREVNAMLQERGKPAKYGV